MRRHFCAHQPLKLRIQDAFFRCLLSVLLESAGSHGELRVCVSGVCLYVCVFRLSCRSGAKAKNNSHNSCRNSNSSPTETLWRAKESICIPATIQYNIKI